MAETAFATDTLVVLEPITCFKCGVAFGVPADFKRYRLNDHQTFWCPNGHEQHFTGKSEAERLRDKLKAAESSANYWREVNEANRRSLAATKGVLTRTKNRIAAGTCPCCNKQFKVLAKHMAEKHPEFTAEES